MGKLVLDGIRAYKQALENPRQVPELRKPEMSHSLLLKPLGQIVLFKGLVRALQRSDAGPSVASRSAIRRIIVFLYPGWADPSLRCYRIKPSVRRNAKGSLISENSSSRHWYIPLRLSSSLGGLFDVGAPVA